ncbi:MAG: hypothetical protein M3Z27_04350 [Actinomycetota bacterium]|nr:hypothetical protein [Actinomycetota bacterium]
MSSGGADALKAAIRRSLPILIALIVLGAIAVNLFKHLQGPRYQASSRVEVSATPLSSIITGTQPAFVDPQRVQDTAQALAQSPQVYGLAAQRNPQLGDAETLQTAVSVAAVPDTDILEFTAASSDSGKTIRLANDVAQAYIAFRSQLSGQQVQSTATKLQSTLVSLPAGSTQRAQVQQQLNRLKLLQGANSSDSVVVESANTAAKTSPAPLKDSLLGLALGLVIALIVVALREAIDTTVRSESDVEDLLSAPVLASVRSIPRRAQFVTYGRHEAMFADTYALLAAQLSPAKKSGEKVILAVTSALAREGKTTTCANLAVAAAQRGSDVLLVDFDFRKGNLSKMFEVPVSAPGVVQVLDASATLDEAVWSVSLDGPKPIVYWNGDGRDEREPTSNRAPREGSNGRAVKGVGSLSLLPTGGLMPAHKMAQQKRLGQLLRALHSHADLVILDTPPATLTVEMTELAQLIDAVLVVVRQGRVSQRTLRSLGRHAKTWPAELAGAVLTDVPAVGEYRSYYAAT